MKRTEFIKNIALTLGGTTLLACESDLIDNLLPKGVFDKIEIDEAKEYFEKEYLKKYSNLRVNKANYHNRKANWSKAFKEKKKGVDKEEEFVVVPIEYDENKFPAILMYTEETKYLTKLPKAGSLLIKEYLIVTKNKGKNEAFLAQVCAQPNDNIRVANNFVDINSFTGVLIKADWEDKPSTGYKYKNRKIISFFDTSITTNAKIQNCTPIFYGYQTVNIIPCSGNYGVSYSGGCLEAVYTSYTDTSWLCTYDTSFDSYNPYFNYNYSGGSSYSNGSYYDTNIYPNNINGYNACRVIENVGNDRNVWNDIIQNSWSALGLFNNIQDFTIDGADALAKSLGGSLTEFLPVASTTGKWISGFSVFIDGMNFSVAVNQIHYSSDQLYKDPNLHFKFTLLVLGAVSSFAALPIDAVIVGGLLIYYGINEENYKQKCNKN